MAAITKSGLPASVIVLGYISFLNELSSQVVAPLIPLLLATAWDVRCVLDSDH